MAQQNIDFGTFPDDPDADAIRTAFQKVQNNFTELFAYTSGSQVTSVNRTTGAGITVNSPTGNVVVTANIACVQVSTSSLSIGVGGNGGTSALITQGSQVLVVDLPNNISTANLIATGNANIGGYANVVGNANVGNLGTAGLITATGNVSGGNLTTSGVLNATGNVSGGNLTTSGALSVTGNANVGNIGATGAIFTGNITSANANLGNSVTANYFVGDGSLLSNVTAVAGAVIVNGTSYSNVIASGGNVVTGVAGSIKLNVHSSGIEVTGTGNISGNLTAANANLGNSVTANYFVGNLYGTANSAGNASVANTVVDNAQPNITSVGTLSSLSVSGNANVGNIGATLFVGAGNNLSNIQGANVSGAVANATYAVTAGSAGSATTAGTVTTASQPNITSVGTLTTLNVSGNANVGNIGATLFVGAGNNLSNIQGANVSGQVSYAAVANSVAGGNVSGQVSYAAVANSVAGANVSGTVSSATSASTASTVTANAQANITSVGTLTSLSVTGNILAGNVNAGNLLSANFIQGDGGLLTNISVSAGSQILNGNSNVSVSANGNVLISVTGVSNVLTITDTGVNVSGTGNFVGNLSAGNINGANKVTANFFTGTITTNAQPNITSLGTLSVLNVSGTSNLGPNSNVIITGGSNNQFLLSDGAGGVKWITPANVTTAPGSNTQVVFNDAGSINATSGLTFNKSTNALTVTGNVSAGNISGTTGAFTNVSGTLTTNSQTNITTVGTLGNLTVTGNINSGNLFGNGFGLSSSNGANVSGAVAYATTANSVAGANVSGQVNFAATANSVAGANVSGTVANATYATTAGSATTAGTVTTNAQPNITSLGSLSSLIVTGNINAGNISGGNNVSANYFTGTLYGAANTAGTVTTAAQPNITSVGTLTGLSVNGSITASTITSNVATGTSPLTVASTTLVTNLNADLLDGYNSATAATANTVVVRDANASFSANIITGTLYGAANSASIATTVTGATQSNITAVGTLTSLGVSGNITAANITANTGVFSGNGSSLTALNASNISTGTLAQARLANSSLSVNGTSISLGGSGTVTANTTQTLTFGSYLTGTSFNGGTANTIAVDATTAATANKVVARDANGSFSANVITASLTGAASTAGTVTTNAQPNITSVGTLTSLSSGNITSSGYIIRSVTTGISAAGLTQGTATAITKEINIVATVSSGQGVVLPTATAGMVIVITNTSANSLNVYPASGGAINALAADAAFSQASKATIQFIAPTSTQWYTVGGTYA